MKKLGIRSGVRTRPRRVDPDLTADIMLQRTDILKTVNVSHRGPFSGCFGAFKPLSADVAFSCVTWSKAPEQLLNGRHGEIQKRLKVQTEILLIDGQLNRCDQ